MSNMPSKSNLLDQVDKSIMMVAGLIRQEGGTGVEGVHLLRLFVCMMHYIWACAQHVRVHRE